jgi:hypothetical protein
VCSFPFLPWLVVVCWEGGKSRGVIIVHRILGRVKNCGAGSVWAFQGGGGGWVWGIGLKKDNYTAICTCMLLFSC